MRPPRWGARWIAAYYFLYFASVGITLPFLPGYFVSLGLSATQAGVLLALSPLFGLVGPPLFARWADRTGRRDRVLLWVTAAALVTWAPLATVKGFAGCAAVMAAYALFSSAIVPLVDTLALDQVSREGGDYSHLRLFGSLGFIAAAASFGLLVDGVGRAIVFIPLALLALDVGVGLKLREPQRRTHASPRSGWRPDRELVFLLAATCLHWIANAPYNGTFILYVQALGLPAWVAGVSAALGVTAEVCVMGLYPRLAHAARPRTLLCVAFLASGLRWAGMAVATHAAAIVVLTLLHGLTFGLFYVAAVDALYKRVPASNRAQGQGLFVAITFGLGGLLGYLAAGAGFDALGGSRLFALAAGVEVLACGFALASRPAAAVR